MSRGRKGYWVVGGKVAGKGPFYGGKNYSGQGGDDDWTWIIIFVIIGLFIIFILPKLLGYY